jgi:hypothetical protein
MNKTIHFIAAIIFVAGSFSTAQAQENFYRVYQFETPFKGHLELTQWTTYIANSDESYEHFGKYLSRDQLLATSIEAEYGVTDHFVLAGYADFDDPKNGHFNYTQSRIEARYRFAERFDYFVNTAVYLEYYFPNQSYSNSQELEARLILDKDIEDFRIAVNPTLSKYINGDEDQSWQPAVSAGFYYRRGKVIQPGVEYYENFHEKSIELFPTLDVNISGAVQWHLGAGFGVHGPSDDLILKSILQVDLQAIRPTHLMRKKFQG